MKPEYKDKSIDQMIEEIERLKEEKDTSIPCDLSYTPKQEPVKQMAEIIKQLDKWIEDCETQISAFAERKMLISETSSLAMQVAYKNVKKIMEEYSSQLPKSELPSDEEIENAAWYKLSTVKNTPEVQEFIKGAKWMRNKIKG